MQSRAEATLPTPPWWRGAVVYQVYIRSFADAGGDGLGDIAGIRSRLPYLRDLGVDAIWITPWYPSPMVDGGYDVTDHRDVAAEFGTLEEAVALVGDAHAHGLPVLLDLVPNHTSDRHPWFQAALAEGPGSPYRQRYLFRPGRGDAGELPPNDWRSALGGSAWTRVTEPDGQPGQWYLHLFSAKQPDLDWSHPDVRAEFEAILRFWFDRGVDGFRIDVAHSLVKAAGLPDVGVDFDDELAVAQLTSYPYWDQEEVHDIYRSWREIADSYRPPRVFVAEAWLTRPERLARYVRPDELHTAFNFDFLTSPWSAAALRRTIDRTLAEHRAVGAPATWVLSNHDVVRAVSRYARREQDRPAYQLRHLLSRPADLDLGLRRARAAALLMLALPGAAYVYQGEELGLWEVEDLPEEVLQDPVWERSGHRDRGRDGCRVPIPWSGNEPPFGFSPEGSTAPPVLPQPEQWKDCSVQAQTGDESSTLELYRAALRLRHAHPALGDGAMRWLDSADDVLLFGRDPGFACLVNISAEAVPVPAGYQVLLCSAPLPDGAVPPDTAVWLSAAGRG